jgi:hypothetical protein
MSDERQEHRQPAARHDPKPQHDAKQQADEQFRAEEKRRADEHKEKQRLRDLVQKHTEAKRKENERRAALSPPERLQEDEKRAAMSPEQRREDDESKGLLAPEQFDQINLLAGNPSFPVLTEGPHPAEFILSEGNGQISRAYGYLADPITIKPGQPLKQTVAPTATTPGTFVPAAVGADCTAIAIYGGTSNAANGLRIAVLVRNAEVNGTMIQWGAITVPEQAIGLATLATVGIIARF